MNSTNKTLKQFCLPKWRNVLLTIQQKRQNFLKNSIRIIVLSAFISPTLSYGIDIDKIKIDGDFRYRHEYFNLKENDPFNRHQLRSRCRLISPVSQNVNVVFQITSGESNAPFSKDQTLTGSFSSKPLWLDKAYAEWEKYDGLVLTAGKAPNPFYRPNNNQLIWNPDVFVEGLSATYTGNGSTVKFFGTASSYWMEQRAVGHDSWLYAAQAGLNLSSNVMNVTGGATLYNFTSTKGNPSFWNAGNSFGNSVDALGNYLNDYKMIQVFTNISFEKASIPFSIYTDVVNNSGADENNMAWLGGISLGKLDKTMDWVFCWEYRQIEKDALVGVLNDPDFADGVTDSKGHKLNLALLLSPNIVADLTYIHSTIGIKNGTYYRRVQFALNFSI